MNWSHPLHVSLKLLISWILNLNLEILFPDMFRRTGIRRAGAVCTHTPKKRSPSAITFSDNTPSAQARMYCYHTALEKYGYVCYTTQSHTNHENSRLRALQSRITHGYPSPTHAFQETVRKKKICIFFCRSLWGRIFAFRREIPIESLSLMQPDIVSRSRSQWLINTRGANRTEPALSAQSFAIFDSFSQRFLLHPYPWPNRYYSVPQ